MSEKNQVEKRDTPQLSPTKNDGTTQNVPSKPDGFLVHGKSSNVDINPQPTPLNVVDDSSGNHLGQNQQDPASQGKADRNQNRTRSSKKVLFICFASALALSFFLELINAKHGSLFALTQFLPGPIVVIWTLVQLSFDKDRSTESNETGDIATSIISGLKQIWKYIRGRNKLFAVFVIGTTISFSAVLAQVHAAGFVLTRIHNALVIVESGSSGDVVAPGGSSVPNDSSVATPAAEQIVPSAEPSASVDPADLTEPCNDDIALPKDPASSVGSPTQENHSELQELFAAITDSANPADQAPAPSDCVLTKYLLLMEPDRFRVLTEAEESALFFFSGEYCVENWWDDTEVLDVVRRDAESLIQSLKPNLFNDAPEEVKEKVSKASESEKTLTNSWELDEVLSSREAVYVNYPMFSLAVLIAENYARFGLAYNDCHANPDTIEYYFGQAIHWYREAMMFGPAAKDEEHLLRFIGHRYHDLAACLPFGSERQLRASALANAYYAIADSITTTENYPLN